jgi:hypothetical protein
MKALMKAIELLGNVDDQHRLRAEVPEDVPTGAVRVIVLVPEEDTAGNSWAEGIAAAWSDELSDTRQDVYTLNDGRPVNASR